MQKHLEEQVVNLENINKALDAANKQLQKIIDYKEGQMEDILQDTTSIMDLFNAELKKNKIQNELNASSISK